MAIVHVVLFKFKPNIDPNAMQQIVLAMLDLRSKCVSPATNEPYILNSSGGRNNSPEGLSEGFSHAFVTIFASEEDRAYYLEKDPVHLQFVKDATEVVEKILVVDYEPSSL